MLSSSSKTRSHHHCLYSLDLSLPGILGLTLEITIERFYADGLTTLLVP